MTRLVQASTERELRVIAELFREYAAGTGIDLCFQNFEEELKTLPGKYGPPRGRLYLLFDNDLAAGCGALRPMDVGVTALAVPERAEMKRLYVRPQFRRRGFARILTEKLIQDARELGYRSIYLDTLRSMTAARNLYASLGFVAADRYYENPLPEVCYLKLDL
jgi:putative acetyltransferase